MFPLITETLADWLASPEPVADTSSRRDSTARPCGAMRPGLSELRPPYSRDAHRGVSSIQPGLHAVGDDGYGILQQGREPRAPCERDRSTLFHPPMWLGFELERMLARADRLNQENPNA